MYLFSYYMGSSVAGASGGLFYAADGWLGVALFVGALVVAGLLIALRLCRLQPLAQLVTPPAPMSKGAMP
jgi:YNFM family putative membrane transporter